jgi:hypothetical protein
MKRILPVLLIAVITITSLAACSGGRDFTFAAKTETIDFRDDVVSFGIYTAPADGGYYVLSSFRNELTEMTNNTYGTQIAFIDDAGERRSKVLNSYNGDFKGGDNYMLSYYGIWYKDSKIYTAYGIVSLEDDSPFDLVFDVYDENFNLIKSVTPGTIERWGYARVVFDGEYFYYASDDPRTGAEIPYPNSDARVYRLNTELELVDSVNPTDKPTEPAGILQLALSGDGRVYTIYFEEYFFGTRYKMKPYGENEKPVIIDGDLLDAEISTVGDSNFLTYYYDQNSERGIEESLFGIKPNGKVERINIERNEPIYEPNALLYSAVENGTRVSFHIESDYSNEENKRDLQKIILTPTN